MPGFRRGEEQTAVLCPAVHNTDEKTSLVKMDPELNFAQFLNQSDEPFEITPTPLIRTFL